MSPAKYLEQSHYRDMTHLSIAMDIVGLAISYPMLRRNIIGTHMPSQEAWEAWEDFTHCKVTKHDLVDQHFKFLAEKE